MWSHYANHHRGFCVEYDYRDGTKSRKIAREVHYKDDVPSLTAADFAPPKKQAAFEALWLTKATCWAYEEEWRVMMTEGERSYQTPSAVVSIIFGTRMPEAERLMLARAVRHQPEIQFKEAKLRERRFLIEITDV